MASYIHFYNLGLVAIPQQCLPLPSAWQTARVAMSVIGRTVWSTNVSQDKLTSAMLLMTV